MSVVDSGYFLSVDSNVLMFLSLVLEELLSSRPRKICVVNSCKIVSPAGNLYISFLLGFLCHKDRSGLCPHPTNSLFATTQESQSMEKVIKAEGCLRRRLGLEVAFEIRASST